MLKSTYLLWQKPAITNEGRDYAVKSFGIRKILFCGIYRFLADAVAVMAASIVMIDAPHKSFLPVA